MLAYHLISPSVTSHDKLLKMLQRTTHLAPWELFQVGKSQINIKEKQPMKSFKNITRKIKLNYHKRWLISKFQLKRVKQHPKWESRIQESKMVLSGTISVQTKKTTSSWNNHFLQIRDDRLKHQYPLKNPSCKWNEKPKFVKWFV